MKQDQLYAYCTKKRINKNKNTAESAHSLPTPSIRGFLLCIGGYHQHQNCYSKPVSLCSIEITNYFEMWKL